MFYKNEEYESAAYWFREAAAVAWADSCSPLLWARARANMSRNVRMGDPAKGADRAIDTLLADLALSSRKAPACTGLFHFHLARSLFTKSDYWGALPHYEAAATADRAGYFVTPQSGQYLYLPLGNLYTRLGEYQTAVHILQTGIDSANAQQDRAGTAKIYADLGIAYAAQNKPEAAMKAYTASKKHFEETRADTEPEEWNGDVSILLTDMAEAALQLSDTASALKWATEALALDAANPGAYLNAALLSKMQGQDMRAAEQMRYAESLYAAQYKDNTLDREFAKVLLSMDAHSEVMGQLARYQKALSCVIPHFAAQEPFANPDPRTFYPENTIVEGLDLKSQAAWEQYRKSGDLRWLHLADTTAALSLIALDTLLRTYDFESSKLYAWKTTRTLYEHRLQILFELFQKGIPGIDVRLMAFSEKNRGVLLRQKIMEEQAVLAARTPADEWHNSVSTLKRKIQRLKQLIPEQEAAGNSAEETKRVLTATEIEWRKINRKIIGDAVARADTAIVRADTVYDIQAVRTLLPDAQARLISYFYNPATGRLYLLSLGRDTLQCASTHVSPALIEEFIGSVKERSAVLREADTAFLQGYVARARLLYDSLLAPVLGAIPPARLIIAPDGILGSLPFDLLLPTAPAHSQSDFHRYPYLLRTTAISLVPSASVVLAVRSQAHREGACGYLGVAPAYAGYFPPVYHGATCTRYGSALFQGKRMTGFEATKARFLKIAARFQILHFYGHGEADGSDPEHSYLAFALPAERTKAASAMGISLNAVRPGLPASEVGRVLYAHEIRQLQLPAELVLLTACETGLGQDAGPEGILSLSRAFMDAGCRAAVMTLWKVDDQSTALLSRSFLDFLKQGMPKDEALRQAKLAFIAESESAVPFYWSGLMLTGDAQPLKYASCGCTLPVGEEYVECPILFLSIALLGLCLLLLRQVWRHR
jgi:CHAT domain-containing protein